MKILAIALCLLLGGALVFVVGDFPDWGDPMSPPNDYRLSKHFIENTMEETSVPNIVTAVLADYRGFDTMFETAVIFTAALACFFLLRTWGRRPSKPDNVYMHLLTGVHVRLKHGKTLSPQSRTFARVESEILRYDLVTSTVCRLMIPFIQLFALYVVAHGHHSPGGGFQGGVILGASFLLLAISHDLRTLRERFPEVKLMYLLIAGIVLYSGVGFACMIYGGNFLEYEALGPLMGVTPVMAHSLGILFVEIGVAMTVMATMILIYNYISSLGTYERGL
ncbi:MAG: sodium:proton antiporter [Desulfovibrio sp.]|nr:MAG: sodium:proton antiporter [Desulfovibrio sp.]